MSKPNNGGPAFPTENNRQTGPNSWHYEGMTIRQYYKAAALDSAYVNEEIGDPAKVAKHAAAVADALIAEDEEFEKRGSE